MQPFSEAELTEEIDALTPPQVAEIADVLLEEANDEYLHGGTWLERIYEEGVTETLIEELNVELEKRRVMSCNRLDPVTRQFKHRELKEVATSTGAVEALLVIILIYKGEADRLKRCAFEECGKYFFGNAKAKYCSDKCGSNVRIRKIRRNQKARQSI